MIFGGIYGGIKNILNPITQNKFIVYDMQAITATNKDELAQFALITFDGVDNLNYQNSIEIPTQALENRQFSNDSIIDKPFTVKGICAISQAITSADDIGSDKEGNVVGMLDYLLKSDTLVVIFRQYPLFATYTNMHLETWQYSQKGDNTALFANLTFREIRTVYDPNTINDTTANLNGTSFDDSALQCPTDAAVVDNGFVTPANPTGDISSLGQFNSQFGGLT